MSDWLEVHAYADNELQNAEKQQVTHQLADSARLNAEFLAVQTVKNTLKEKCQPVTCEATWKRCQKRLDEIDRTRRVESFVGRYAWGICAIFFFCIFGAGLWHRSLGPSFSTGDVARISASMTPLSSGPQSQNVEDKRKWIDGLFDSQAPVQTDNVQVLGGSIAELNGQRVVRMRLADRQGFMDLFVVRNANHIDGADQMDGRAKYSVAKIGSRNCIAWTDHGFGFLVVGDRSIDDLCAIGDALNAVHQ